MRLHFKKPIFDVKWVTSVILLLFIEYKKMERRATMQCNGQLKFNASYKNLGFGTSTLPMEGKCTLCDNFGIWDLGFGIWDLGFGIWDLEFGILNPSSSFSSPPQY